MLPYIRSRRMIGWSLYLLGLILTGGSSAAQPQNSEALWAALRQPEHFAIIRHALAPGTGDPANFRLGDCATQRNLSASGRAQARRIGDSFRAGGIASASVYSSQWCRCLETARLLGLGDVIPLPSLNSFFSNRSESSSVIEQLRQDIQAMDLSRPVILVSHQVNITALTGVYPRSGEMVVMRRGRAQFEVVGRLALE